MPVFVFAAVAALFLLVRRTWKASKKRRVESPVNAQEPEVAEDEPGDFRRT